jgi:hypothetical protein
MNEDRNHNAKESFSTRPQQKSSITQPVVIKEGRRSTAGLWAAIVILFAALVGLGAYGYLALQKNNIALNELPGMKDTTSALADRLDAAEEQFTSWGEQWHLLQKQVDRLDKKIVQSRAQAREEAQQMVAQLHTRLEQEMQERDQAVDARFNRLESDQQGVRTEMAQLGQNISAVAQESGAQVGLLQNRLDRGERNLDALARQLDHQRLDFELAKKNTRELAPGVSLRVTGTDVRRQQFDGWLWLMPDRRTLWVRDLGLQQPLIFYHKDGDDPSQLVITRVTKNAVIGYLLLPAGSQATLGASAEREKPAASDSAADAGTL